MKTALGFRHDYGVRHKSRHRSLAFLFVITAVIFVLSGCATLGIKTSPPVTVADIIKMSQDKVPADEIISKMRKSGTVYRLRASELAKLKEEGVPDAVIDYMQQTYLTAVRRNQALEDWSYWNSGSDGYWYGGGPYGWPDEWYESP